MRNPVDNSVDNPFQTTIPYGSKPNWNAVCRLGNPMILALGLGEAGKVGDNTVQGHPIFDSSTSRQANTQ